MKRILASVLCAFSIISCLGSTAFAATDDADQYIDPNAIVSTHEDVSAPDNVIITRAYSVSYDHKSAINWNASERQVEGNTQATQGTIKLSSYSRARFEHTWWQGGSIYCDSGRVWSTTEGARSYAYSGWETYEIDNSGVACTYYGIDV